MQKYGLNKYKIIYPIFPKKETNNYVKGSIIQSENTSELNNKKNRLKKNLKINLFNQKNNSLIIFILFIFNNLLQKFTLTFVDFHSSIITIKINETGMQNIFFEGETCYQERPKFDFPDEVIINGIAQINISGKYYLERSNNTIQLIWNEPRDNWGCLFKNCSNIIEIDFSQFDFSQSIQGNLMFSGCQSLTSINFGSSEKLKIKDSGSFF